MFPEIISMYRSDALFSPQRRTKPFVAVLSFEPSEETLRGVFSAPRKASGKAGNLPPRNSAREWGHRRLTSRTLP